MSEFDEPRESLRAALRRVSFLGLIHRRLTEITVRHWLLKEAHRLEREAQEWETRTEYGSSARQAQIWRCLDQANILREMSRGVDS